MRSALPPVGSRIMLKGLHPWAKNVVVVLKLVRRRYAGSSAEHPQARVRIETTDAMNGHECYIGEHDWKPWPEPTHD